MEEAEALSDKVLILSRGKILCSGSTERLKLQYGAGYLLKLQCGPNFEVKKVMETLTQFIPGADIKVFTFKIFYNYFLFNNIFFMRKEQRPITAERHIALRIGCRLSENATDTGN